MKHTSRVTYDCDLCGKKDCEWVIKGGEVKLSKFVCKICGSDVQ